MHKNNYHIMNINYTHNNNNNYDNRNNINSNNDKYSNYKENAKNRNNNLNNKGNNINNNIVIRQIPTIKYYGTLDSSDNGINKTWCILPYGIQIKSNIIRAVSSAFKNHFNNKNRYHKILNSNTIRLGY